jgi:hypothetical protein
MQSIHTKQSYRRLLLHLQPKIYQPTRYRIKRILATEGNTPIAYDLVNYEIGAEQYIMNKLKTVPGVIEASEVNDIIKKITSDNVRNLKEDTIHHI